MDLILIGACLISGGLSAIGYGIGQGIRYGVAGLEAKALKSIAGKVGNGTINKLLVKMRAGVNIGMKSTNKIANGLFETEKDLIGVGIESLASSIPDLIYNLF